SAGDTTSRSSAGGTRSGSRKNQSPKPRASTSGTRDAGCPARVPIAPTSPSTPAAVPRTGQPSRAIVTPLLVPGAVDEPVGGEPGHQPPELRADVLDRMLRGFLA